MSADEPPAHASKAIAPQLGRAEGPMGFVARATSDGGYEWQYEVKSSDFNPYGVLHGGVVMTLLDTAMGWEVAMRITPSGRINAAAQMNIHFLAPIRAGSLTARARVIKLGKRLAVVEASALADDGTVIAVATASHSLLPMPSAA